MAHLRTATLENIIAFFGLDLLAVINAILNEDYGLFIT